MPADLPVLALIAVVAAAVAGAALRRIGEREGTSQAHRPGFVAGVVDLVDASVGAFLLRRLSRRPTTTRAEARAERARLALAGAAADARRAAYGGPEVAAPTRLVVAGTAASHSPEDLLDRQAHPLTGTGGVIVRARWSPSRSGFLAAAGLVAIVVAGFGLWSRNEGHVLSSTGTPAPSSGAAPAAATPDPSPTPTPDLAPSAAATTSPTPTAPPTATPTARPTATPTARPTATPTPRPTRTPKPTSTPKPTAKPTATPAATPTPAPTPTPPATPTPAPTPTPPPPTPEPTPVPTP